MTNTNRGTCTSCSWEGVLRQDGTMRRHFMATYENSKGKRVQDKSAGRCPGGRTFPASQVPVSSVQDRIMAAHGELAYDPGALVGLTRLRDYLADVSRTDMDAALSEMFLAGRIALIEEINTKALTARDHAAALHIVGDEKHLYRPN